MPQMWAAAPSSGSHHQFSCYKSCMVCLLTCSVNDDLVFSVHCYRDAYFTCTWLLAPVDGQYSIKSHLDSQSLRVLANELVNRKSVALKPSVSIAHEYLAISRKGQALLPLRSV